MPTHRKKRKYELGRPAANTKIGVQRIHTVRTRGGNKKYRALRLDHGNFSWGSEGNINNDQIMYNTYYVPIIMIIGAYDRSNLIKVMLKPVKEWRQRLAEN